MLEIRGYEGSLEAIEMSGYGSWLSDRLGKTGAGIAIGAATLGAGYLAQSQFQLGTKALNYGKSWLPGNTTAGKGADFVGPMPKAPTGEGLLSTVGGGLLEAGKQIATSAITGSGAGTGGVEGAGGGLSAQDIANINAQQEAARREESQKGGTSWMPLALIGAAAAAYFAMK